MKNFWKFLTDKYSIPDRYQDQSADNNVLRMNQLMFFIMLLGTYWLICDCLFSHENPRFQFLITYDVTMIIISLIPFVISFIFIKLKVQSISVKVVFIYIASLLFFVTLLWRLQALDNINDVGFLITTIIYLTTYCMSIVLLFDISPIVYVISVMVCAVLMTINIGDKIFKVDLYNIYLFCIALLVVSLYKRRESIKFMKQKILVDDMNATLELQAQQLQLQQIELNQVNEELLTQQEQLIEHKKNLENEVLTKTRDLFEKNEKIISLQNHTIIALSTLVENRDSDTGEHIKRTAAYVKLLTEKAFLSNKFEQLTSDSAELFAKAAPMHDVGKIVVSDAILKKTSRLTPEEFEQIKKHTTEGGRIVTDILGKGENADYIKIACDIATYHHEKYNGSGYPYSLQGEQIPLCARIMAVGDVFDALVSKRCYKEPMSIDDAFEIIENDAAKHFDPILARLFIDSKDEVLAIMEKYSDK